jgi:hypothetical protein
MVAYVPTLSDARKWAEITDKFITLHARVRQHSFVEDLLDLSSVDDGHTYVGSDRRRLDRRVDIVEAAFEQLLADSNSN